MTESAGVSIDDLLDRAVSAINRGDRVAATALAGQVLAVDYANSDAEDLLAAPTDAGEIRRLTILFADLVDSTVLSTKLEPETYRLLVGRYRQQVQQAVDRYGATSPQRKVMACWRYSAIPLPTRTTSFERCRPGWKSRGT
jgi:class 3 adenylate cyclase